MAIHPLAYVHPDARIDEDVEIGAFCWIGPDVTIGPRCRLLNHVTIAGHTSLGAENRIWPGAVIGTEPQDITYQGTPTRVRIGDRNLIRECVTINRATEKGDGVTLLGSDNFLMACCHVAHDCVLQDHITMANGALLGGHVYVESHATLSGAVGVHHFATIGRYAFVGGLSRLVHDVPPYMTVEGHPSRVRCVNVVGLRRHNFTKQQIDALGEAHRLIYRAKMGRVHAGEILASHSQLTDEVQNLLDFIAAQDKGRHGRSRERLRKR
jgi:UDP-N-acetylglucosamine acyltransferase